MMLEVGFLLDDPDFCQVFTVLHVTETVNDRGRAEYTETPEEARGCVQPLTPRELELLPEGSRDRETLAVYTRAPLTAGSLAGGAAQDVLLLSGVRYTVMAVETWPDYTRTLVQRELDHE